LKKLTIGRKFRMRKERRRLEIEGIVQGVGFRPFVYHLAKRYNLKGFVLNNTMGVIIDLEGRTRDIEKFIENLKERPPPLAKIKKIESKTLSIKGYKDFRIRDSKKEDKKIALVSPDMATCDDCREELLNPYDRRYLYPFINCTNCGPRFTITKELPYDRKNTTMKKFKMCEKCISEYENPEDRRFHAQPNACEECGPHIQLIENKGGEVEGDPIERAIDLLKRGYIVAIKGLGGFHLASNAEDSKAVRILRERKKRPHEPFALMAGEISVIRKFTYLSNFEEEFLKSPKAPILLLRKKENCSLPEEIAPNNRFLGFMLPYTPLHILLFQKPEEIRVLIMTSGNRKGDPMIFKNEEALSQLGDIADYFLLHNRDIHIQADDSVARIFPKEERPLLIRRSRGYVPEPIKSPVNAEKNILGCGAHLKNTFSLSRKDEIFISHHIGNLESPEAFKAYQRGIEHFIHLFDTNPDVVVVDRHPEYLSTKFGKRWAKENNKVIVEVQHHHAHIASCLVDNGINRKVIGIAWDGTGFGDDGAIWGGEFLIASLGEYKRKAHLKYIPLPGGEKAVREPWRMAVAYLYEVLGEDFLDLDMDFLHSLNREKWKAIKIMLDKKINSPLTSSMGRLFDAISSLVGIRNKITYLGQAAIELEMSIGEEEKGSYHFDIERDEEIYIIDPAPVISSVVQDLIKGIEPSIIATRFHRGLVEMIIEVSNLIREETSLNEVALSGGVLLNLFIRKFATQRLREEGFFVYNHSKIPPNDGGISVGQVAIAESKFSQK